MTGNAQAGADDAPATPARRGHERMALARALLDATKPFRPADESTVEQLAGSTSEELLASTCGGANAAKALLGADDAAWQEYIGYTATEQPTFFIGHEAKAAKAKLSRAAWKIYEAAHRSNMTSLLAGPICALIEAIGDEGTQRTLNVMGRLAEAQRKSRESGLKAAFARNGSPL